MSDYEKFLLKCYLLVVLFQLIVMGFTISYIAHTLAELSQLLVK